MQAAAQTMEANEVRDKVLGQTYEHMVEVRAEDIDKEGRTVPFILTSDRPIEHWFGYLILDHSSGSIRMDHIKSGLPFLVDHDVEKHIGLGIPETFRSDKVEGYSTLKGTFKVGKSPLAQEKFDDMLDGIRPYGSIGFILHDMEIEEKGNGKDKPDIYRSKDWEPIEFSTVYLGRDKSSKIGRAIQYTDEQLEQIKTLIARTLEEHQQQQTINNDTQVSGGTQMSENTNVRSEEEILEAVQKRLAEIESLEKRHNVDLAEYKFGKKSKADIAEVRGYVLEQIPEDKPLDTPAAHLDMPESDVREYNFLNVIKYLVDPVKYAKEAAREVEASKEVAKKLGYAPRGLFVPADIEKRRRSFLKRDLTVGGSTSGAELVGTDHIPTLIELLRNKMLLTRMGARYMSGLVGNVSIPRWDGASTAGWTSTEGAGTSESTPTTGALTLSAKEVSANVQYTRLLLQQSSPDVAALVEDDLMAVLALAIDKAGFHGAGGSGEPQGIVGTSGVGAVTIASMDWDAAVEFESDVDAGNALDGTMFFATTPAVRGTLKSRAKESGYPVYIVSENNVMNGYPVMTTNQINTGYIIFGNFAQVIIGEWGGLDLIVDQSASTGKFTVGAFKTVDLGIRQSSAFSVGASFS